MILSHSFDNNGSSLGGVSSSNGTPAGMLSSVGIGGGSSSGGGGGAYQLSNYSKNNGGFHNGNGVHNGSNSL